MKAQSFEHLIKAIKEGEGWRDKPYDCDTGKPLSWADVKGEPTLGWGFSLRNKLPKSVADIWLRFLVLEYIEELDKKYAWFGEEMGAHRQAAVVDMYYILGYYAFGGFPKMIQAFEVKDYTEAAKQCLDSVWARRIGKRSHVIADSIRNDTPLELKHE